MDIDVELGAEGEHGGRKMPRTGEVPRDDMREAQGVSDWGKEEERRGTGNTGCEVSSAGATVGGVVRGGGAEEGTDLREVGSAEVQPGAKKVNKAPARLLKRVREERGRWEGLQTLQELRFPKRMKEE